MRVIGRRPLVEESFKVSVSRRSIFNFLFEELILFHAALFLRFEEFNLDDPRESKALGYRK